MQAINTEWSNAETMLVWTEVFHKFSVKGWDEFYVGFCTKPTDLAPGLKQWAETYLKNLPLHQVAWEEIAENMINTYHHG